MTRHPLAKEIRSARSAHSGKSGKRAARAKRAAGAKRTNTRTITATRDRRHLSHTIYFSERSREQKQTRHGHQEYSFEEAISIFMWSRFFWISIYLFLFQFIAKNRAILKVFIAEIRQRVIAEMWREGVVCPAGNGHGESRRPKRLEPFPSI
jgi:hypothetical protein